MRRVAAVLALLAVAACAAPPVEVPDDADLDASERAAYVAAYRSYLQGAAGAVAEVLGPALAHEPWHIPSHVLRQDAAAAAGDGAALRAWYAAEAAARPDDGARVLLAARVAGRDGAPRVDAYRRALALAPESPWPAVALTYELLRVARAEHESARAASDAGFAADAAARDARADAALAEALASAESVARAHADLAAAHAARAEALLARAVRAGDRTALAAAQDAAALAVARAPGDPAAHALLARVRREAIDDAGAEAALRDALRLAPDDADLLAGLGRVLLDLGRPAEARDALERAATRAPADAVIRTDLGVACHATGDSAGAVLHLDAAAALAPADPRPLEALTLVHLARGEAAAARAALERYRERGGPQAAALAQLVDGAADPAR